MNQRRGPWQLFKGRRLYFSGVEARDVVGVLFGKDFGLWPRRGG